MRLGKHEKEILKCLSVYHDGNMEWTWRENNGYLSKLADPPEIAEYEKGNIVPLWMLIRDVKCRKGILSRSLKTLEAKGLVVLLDACLDIPYKELSSYTKHVRITGKGLFKIAALKS